MRIAPGCKEPPAAQVQGLHDHSKTPEKSAWIWGTVTRSEWEPCGTCQKVGNVIGSVDSTRRGPLMRQVPPAEASVESAAKKRQCERIHRSKEREVCAIRAKATGGWPGVE